MKVFELGRCRLEVPSEFVCLGSNRIMSKPIRNSETQELFEQDYLLKRLQKQAERDHWIHEEKLESEICLFLSLLVGTLPNDILRVVESIKQENFDSSYSTCELNQQHQGTNIVNGASNLLSSLVPLSSSVIKSSENIICDISDAKLSLDALTLQSGAANNEDSIVSNDEKVLVEEKKKKKKKSKNSVSVEENKASPHLTTSSLSSGNKTAASTMENSKVTCYASLNSSIVSRNLDVTEEQFQEILSNLRAACVEGSVEGIAKVIESTSAKASDLVKYTFPDGLNPLTLCCTKGHIKAARYLADLSVAPIIGPTSAIHQNSHRINNLSNLTPSIANSFKALPAAWGTLCGDHSNVSYLLDPPSRLKYGKKQAAKFTPRQCIKLN